MPLLPRRPRKRPMSLWTSQPKYASLWMLVCLWTHNCHGLMHQSYHTAFRIHNPKQQLQQRTTFHKYSTQLHGIKGFRAWFDSQFPEATVEIRSNESHDTFDHVLVDMNQILHVILRRSRDEDHAVRMLMSELDRVLSVATPRHSLVLAIDGAPAAAKLATQRRRRYGTLIRTEWKLQHFDKLQISKRQRAKKLRSYHSELRSLQITPATPFLKHMEASILYWAWQRLQQRNGRLQHVRIFLSPSSVPGEGEVKILEWVLQRPRQGQSLAIVGRDSDLLLEGLIIPPQWTHNVFILKDEAPQTFLSVSLWETTRKLQTTWLPPNAPASQICQVRTDLVLLMILNGNDYLPKLRCSKGFSNVCQSYRRLIQTQDEWQDMGLVDPDTLEFRLDFCIRFFDEVAKRTKYLNNSTTTTTTNRTGSTTTPLRELNSIIDAGFVPKPKHFRILRNRKHKKSDANDEDMEAKEDYDDDDDENVEVLMDDADDEDVIVMDEDNASTKNDYKDEKDYSDKVLIQLTLGTPGSEGFLKYELWHDAAEPLKRAKHQLAAMALDDFLGTDYANSEVYNIEEGINSAGYSWEVTHSVEGLVDRYLGGLLWNLQTYQDGICADYQYNYGRRMSPLASEIADFFREAKAQNRTVGRRELLGDTFERPVSAGLSCLAALPSKVKHLIPEPYRLLSDETVEKFYEQSMDPADNQFDLKLFESLCETEIDRMKANGEISELDGSEMTPHGRRIMTGDHWWTVIGKSAEALKHPFDPPAPPSEAFSPLKPNPWIRVSRVLALDAPRGRTAWGDTPSSIQRTPHRTEITDIEHGSLGHFLEDGETLMDVPYKKDFRAERRALESDLATTSAGKTKKKKEREILKRLETTGSQTKPEQQTPMNTEGNSALAILWQLHDLRMIGPAKFEMTLPSKSAKASMHSGPYENVRLIIDPGVSKAINILQQPLDINRDRDLSKHSKQATKQHLADLALSEILGEGYDWKGMPFVELRTILLKRTGASSQMRQKSLPKDVEYNQDGQSAMSCLKQLSDVGMIGEMTYTYVEMPNEKTKNGRSVERVRLVIEPPKTSGKVKNLLLDQQYSISKKRPLKGESRQVARQKLASLAPTEIAGEEIDWVNCDFASLRQALQDKTTNGRVQQK